MSSASRLYSEVRTGFGVCFNQGKLGHMSRVGAACKPHPDLERVLFSAEDIKCRVSEIGRSVY